MVQDNNNPSGENLQNAGGDVDNVVTENNQEDKVSHSTYLKVLSEKKKAAEKLKETQQQLNELLAAKEEAEKARLEEQGNYKEINKNLETKIQELQSTITKRDAAEMDAIKFHSVLDALGGKVDRKFYPLINFEDVLLDPETKQPDELSVSKVADKIKTEYPEIIQGQSGPNLPPGAPKPGGPKLTVEEWRKLPTKDMKARLHEVVGQAAA